MDRLETVDITPSNIRAAVRERLDAGAQR